MRLSRGKVSLGPLDTGEIDLQIRDGMITEMNSTLKRMTPTSADSLDLNLQGSLVIPGLINSHDHLEFGIFPRLGNGPYPDARSWAIDIYRPEEPPIRDLLRVPKLTRLFWGGLKNLFSGVTTVCHHNSYEEAVFGTGFPVSVLDQYGWAHSPDFTHTIVDAFNHTPAAAPFQIHLGEGTNERSRSEIYKFNEMGLLNKNSVLIHGVAFGSAEWELIQTRGASVVWCPTSNLFVLGKTLDPSCLSKKIRLTIGNDSPLTAEGDLLDEIRAAARQNIPPEQIYSMVTELPAEIFNLRRGEGKIDKGRSADLLIVNDTGEPPAQRLLSLRHREIQLMIRRGRIVLVSEESMSHIIYDDLGWWTNVDFQSHWENTTRILGPDIHLAGRTIRA